MKQVTSSLTQHLSTVCHKVYTWILPMKSFSITFSLSLTLYIKLAILIEGDLKAPFSIAIIPRCREGATPFPGLFHFTLDPYLIILSAKQGGIKYHFLSLWYDLTWDWSLVSWTIGKHSTHEANGPVYNSDTWYISNEQINEQHPKWIFGYQPNINQIFLFISNACHLYFCVTSHTFRFCINYCTLRWLHLYKADWLICVVAPAILQKETSMSFFIIQIIFNCNGHLFSFVF